MSNYDQTTAAAITAAGNAAATGIQNTGNRKSQQRAQRYNYEAWQRQNEYNHPSAQMARLQEAGLNPNMIYGTSASGASGAAQQEAPARPAPFNFDNPLRDITSFADVNLRSAQANNVRTDQTVKLQEAALKGAQTAKLGVDTAHSKVDLQLAQGTMFNSLQASNESLRQAELQTIQAELDTSYKNQSLKDRLKKTYYEAENARQTMTGQQLLNKLRQLQVNLKQLGIEPGDPFYFRILGQGKKKFLEGYQGLKDSYLNPFKTFKQ